MKDCALYGSPRPGEPGNETLGPLSNVTEDDRQRHKRDFSPISTAGLAQAEV